MKQVFLSYHDIHTDCIKLAKLIKKKYKPQKLILISRGGLIPGSIIANYLGIQDIDVIALKTYADRKKNSDIKIFKRIKSEKKLVVIDDLVDSGDTAIGSGFKFPLVISTSIKAKALKGKIINNMINKFFIINSYIILLASLLHQN